MPDLQDGEIAEVKGSGAKPYVLRNSGGVYSCTCPAWRNQSVPIETRTCKHLRQLRGDAAETARIGSVPRDPVRPVPAKPAAPGSPSKEPPLLLAHPWDNITDLAGWWMSEKLDGVRAYWDGNRFLSRQGNVYHAPGWFIRGLPDAPLDGELWIARQMFQRTVSIVRRQDASEHWREVRFVVFDAPARPEAFEARQELLRNWLGDGTEFASVLEQRVCEGIHHLRSELERIVGEGGEGLMLRQPGSAYEVGRSATLFKVKTFLDAEARVVEHLPGEGKHSGRLGALVVEMPGGARFSVGTGFSDAERASPPPLGAVITYRYQELTDRGVPRFPTFMRIRSDLQPELPQLTAEPVLEEGKTKGTQSARESRAVRSGPKPRDPAKAQPDPSAQDGVSATEAARRTLCISGKLPSGLRKSDYDSALQAIGVELVDDVTPGLTYLVLADPASTSSKAERARKLGVTLLSEDEMIAMTSAR